MKNELKELIDNYKDLYLQYNKNHCEVSYEKGWVTVICHNGIFPTKLRAKELYFASMRLKERIAAKELESNN